jgi:DNA gyrase subunit A
MRASTRVENVTPRRKGIVVTELPYNVGPERVIERIAALVQAKKLLGIADVKDLTDSAKGLHLVIEIKNGFHPEAILDQLFRQTPLEESFSINAVALVDGQPRTMTLREMLQVYLDHRYDVVRRRSTHRRTRATERLHLVEGLLVAILDIDEVIQLIRSSDNAEEARQRLMTVFDLTELQANHILDMPLRRLTRLSRLELEAQRSELEATIEELTAILDDPELLRRQVGDELTEVATRYGTPRRTVLLESAGAPASAVVPLEVADEPCRVLLSSTGLLARTSGVQDVGSGGTRARHDVIASVVEATARGAVGLITSAGRLVKLSVLDLPALPDTANAPTLQGGAPVTEFVPLDPGEQVVALASLLPDAAVLALGTRRGVVKRVAAEALAKDSWDLLRLDEGDAVVGARHVTDTDELVFVTSDAQLLHFPAGGVRPQGRSGGGIAGIRLSSGAEVVYFGAVAPDGDNLVATVSGSASALPGTQAGNVKVTPFSEYPGKGRATGGVRCHRFLRGEDTLLLAYVGPAPLKAGSGNGAPVDLPSEHGRRDGSGTPAAQPIAAIG